LTLSSEPTLPDGRTVLSLQLWVRAGRAASQVARAVAGLGVPLR